MRIGIDASRANVSDKTGTEWYAFEIITEIIRQHPDEHTFVLYTKEPLRDDWPPLPKNVRIKILRWPPGFLWTQLRLAWEMLWDAPDVLFVPAHTIPFFAPHNTVTTLHDIGFERYQSLYNSHHIGPSWLSIIIKVMSLGRYGSSELDYHRWSAQRALRKARAVITVSEFSKQEMINVFRTDPIAIHVIPCGYNRAFEVNASEEINKRIKKKYRLPESYFLFIGRIEEKKNVSIMLEAYRLYRSLGGTAGFVLVGKPGYGHEQFKKNLSQPGVLELGWVAQADLPALMQRATVFLFASAYEGFGIPVLEAMASGTPVITSTTSATREVAGNAALLVNPHNAAEIAAAMSDLMNNSELRIRLRDRGRIRCRAFSWEKTAQEIWNVLTKNSQ